MSLNEKNTTFLQADPFGLFAQLGSRYNGLLRNRYAETRLPSQLQALLVTYPDTINIVALVTAEDPDTMAVLPIVARLADACPRMELRIWGDEDDPAPLTLLLPDVDPAAMEEWDLPLFFLFDDEWELAAQWGPRPAAAERPLEEWMARHPEYAALADEDTPEAQQPYATLAAQLVYEMRVWYNSGLAQACLDEWFDLLNGLQASDDTDSAGK